MSSKVNHIPSTKTPKLNVIRFFHVRWLEDEGVISYSSFAKKDDGKPVSIIAPRGGCTFAYKLIHTKQKGEDKLRYRIRFGLAKCNSKDNFCKKIGRELALARLNDSSKAENLNFSIGYTPDAEDVYFNLFEVYYKDQEEYIGNIREIVLNLDEIDLEDLV